MRDLPKSIGSTGFDSVCLGIISEIDGEDHLFVIHRGHNVPTHKNQLAFIGGHRSGLETEMETASREFEEELSVSASNIEWYGFDSMVFTRRQNKMFPVYARVDFETLCSAQSNGEWDFACFYPIKNILDESKWGQFNFHFKGNAYPVYLYLMNFTGYHSIIPPNGQKLESFILWGATARVVWNLRNQLLNKGKDGNL